MPGSKKWHDGTSEYCDRLRAIAGEVLEMDAGDIDMHADFYRDLGVSSLEKVEILARIEQEFSVVLTDGSVARLDSLGDALTVIEDSAGVRP